MIASPATYFIAGSKLSHLQRREASTDALKPASEYSPLGPFQSQPGVCNIRPELLGDRRRRSNFSVQVTLSAPNQESDHPVTATAIACASGTVA